jgi:hypothetical protein
MFSGILTKFFCAFIIFFPLNPSKSLGNAAFLASNRTGDAYIASFSAKNNKIKSKWEEIIFFCFLDVVFYDLR